MSGDVVARASERRVLIAVFFKYVTTLPPKRKDEKLMLTGVRRGNLVQPRRSRLFRGWPFSCGFGTDF